MITLNIATHKAREESLKLVLNAVAKQNTKPDVVNIYINDYTCPQWLKETGYNILEAPEGDLGAAAKFYSTKLQTEGVYITLDDDLIPNDGYVGYLADMAYRYPNSIVGFHGTTYTKWPIDSYFHDKKRTTYYCTQELTRDVVVDMLGTGVMAFRIQNAPDLSVFEEPRMTDPFMCRWAKDNAVSMVCLCREANYLKEVAIAQNTAIWKQAAANDTIQTKTINSAKTFERFRPYKFPVEKLSKGSITWSHLKHIASGLTYKSKLVELGSGLSTSYFRSICHTYSIEHDANYHNSETTNLRPIKNGWYDLNVFDWRQIQNADVIVIDGPKGATGDRYSLPIDLLPKCLIFVDDCHRQKDLQMARTIAETQNRKLSTFKDGIKIMGMIHY
jgi:hypothetical protein